MCPQMNTYLCASAVLTEGLVHQPEACFMHSMPLDLSEQQEPFQQFH